MEWLAGYVLVALLTIAGGSYAYFDISTYPFPELLAEQRRSAARVVLFGWAWPVLLLATLGRWFGRVAVDATRRG